MSALSLHNKVHWLINWFWLAQWQIQGCLEEEGGELLWPLRI